MRCHGLVPWSFTFAANKELLPISLMPRACPVEFHVRRYKKGESPVLENGSKPEPGQTAVALVVEKIVAASVRLHRSSPVASEVACKWSVAMSVRLHGSSPWHLEVACKWSVAASVRLHGSSPWHPEVACKWSVAASVRLHGSSSWHPEVACGFE